MGAAGSWEGPALDMVELGERGEVGVEGVEKAGEVERSLRKAVLNNSALARAHDPVLSLRREGGG